MTSLRMTYRVWFAMAVALTPAFASSALAAPPAADGLVLAAAQPNALLTIDQNRTTVVDRIVSDWGEAISKSGVGLTPDQLREILSGLRADHLLAASLAGTPTGLRDVIANALTATAPAKPGRLHTKALGDTGDDLVYTPVVPCRIVDTRSGAGGVFLPGNQRNWLAFNPGGFASQGGSATNCGIPVRPAAVMVNVTLADTDGGPSFFVVWPFNQARPLASTVNWWGPGQQPANAEIVPLCTGGGCTSDFSAYAGGQTDAIIDVFGYLGPPGAPIGTVSNVATGTGLTGGPITSTGTIGIATGGVGTAQIGNGSVTKTKLAASGGSSGQVLGTDGSNLLWQNISGTTSYVTVAVNYSVSTEVSCPSGYKAVAASCNTGVNVVLQDQFPSPPSGVWSNYLIPSANAATGVHCNIGAGTAQALVRCSN
jgi:hypothetical protein